MLLTWFRSPLKPQRRVFKAQTLWVYEDGGGGEIGKGIPKLGGDEGAGTDWRDVGEVPPGFCCRISEGLKTISPGEGSPKR